MLNAAYGMLAMLPLAFLSLRLRDGVAMTESASSTVDPDEQVQHAADGKLATVVKRLSAKRAQRRREQMEFRTWLKITAKPLW